MNPKLREKTLESLSAVLPITGIVLFISVFLVPMELGTMVLFLAGAIMLILGMGFFQLGAEMSMTPIGEGIGVQISKTKRIWLVMLIGFVMGVIITISESDLQVLAEQVPSIPNMILILTVGVGVGIFLALAIIRIKFRIDLSKLLIVLYIALILVSFFVPGEFLAVAFDSGGDASGPMTSTFLLPLSIGTCTAVGGNLMTDAFGVVALVALTPLIAAIVDRGFSGDVMEAAKKAGAGGGTVLHSRSIESEEATNFWGMSVQEEKEIVLILTKHESKKEIMRAISENCGMQSKAKDLVMSLPIDSVMGI